MKNQKVLNGGIVLIDEPELSMHPLWQEKVLDYYRNLFTTPKNLIQKKEQQVQIIIATHSEYVIKSALEDRENVLVIELKNDNGKIVSRPVVTPTVLPSITLAETNYDTFNIVSTDYHIQLYGYLQTLTNNTQSVKSCDDYIREYIIRNNKDQGTYLKHDSHNNTQYQTLSTYIRNAIDHPDNGKQFTNEELKTSIELLIGIIKDIE